MNKDELLTTLKNEMVLAEARAAGAKRAYELAATRGIYEELKIWVGSRIQVVFSDATREAVVKRIEWSNYDIKDFEGPVLFGHWILKKTKKPSARLEALCSADYVRAGHARVL